MTQMEKARAGTITPEMEAVAASENLPVEKVRDLVAQGLVAIPANINHQALKPQGFGRGLSTKVNANIGVSTQYPEIAKELVKLQAALDAGANAVMDLSLGDNIKECRRQIIAASPVPVGTVPIYQATAEAQIKYGSMIEMSADDLFRVIEEHAQDGVDFITVHCGVTLDVINTLKGQGRIADIVSRGGSFLTGWMLHHGQENPLYAQYDRLLEIALKYDVTLSLGDGLRPGCLADATDRSQVHELLLLGKLVDRAWAKGVQVMVEGPGHVPFNQIQANITLEKQLCKGAPFYVLGPLVTDVAPGYDHITAAIGGTVAAAAGADFLCYVTPAEHLGLPTADDVREGVIASRIAAHAADLVKGIPGAWEWDLEMSKARKAIDWDKQIALSIDPVKAERMRSERNRTEIEGCSMCGEYCAMRVVGQYLGKKPENC